METQHSDVRFAENLIQLGFGTAIRDDIVLFDAMLQILGCAIVYVSVV